MESSITLIFGRLESLTSPGEVIETHPPSSSSRNSSRLDDVLDPTFIENPEHANAVTPNMVKVWKSNHKLHLPDMVLRWLL